MTVCGDYGLLDFLDVCVRDTWTAFLPAVLVSIISILLIPLPQRIRRTLGSIGTLFKPFVTLPEAEALNAQALSEDRDNIQEPSDSHRSIPRWRISVLVFIGVLQVLCWTTTGAWRLSFYLRPFMVWRGGCALMLAVSWIYAIIRPLAHSKVHLPYDLFILYLVFFAGGLLELGGVVFDHILFDIRYPSSFAMTLLVGNVVSISILLGVILSTPVGYPSNAVDAKEIGITISSEDYVTLWKWISFGWVHPLIQLGKRTTLREKDVWNLSATMQSRPLFAKFSTIYRSTLLRRLFAQNSMDVIFDCLLTLATIIFNYAGPFFLKRILDAIDRKNPTKESQAKAYTYAFLALTCAVIKAQVELQHLWFGRRAAIRLRQSLMASIYDKALKRKDLSGIVKKDDSGNDASSSNGTSGRKASKAQGKADKKKAETADDPKAGADIGKIVNLMSIDTTRLAFVIATLTNIYGAPFEMTIAGIFLYQLLGWSAFAGFSIMIVVWPVNTYLTRRRLQIHKTLVTATDKRMGVLNELIGAIKLIKFFAWEERWIGRALDARETELKMLIKARVNIVCLNLIWSCAPVLVAVISFYTYVMTGHELTIGTAFTAIALFNMVKSPVRSIPSTILRLVQANVALKRIQVYLEEDEVDEQVSSLKKIYSTTPAISQVDEGLGFENATLTWNSVTETKKDNRKKASNLSSTTLVEGSNTTVDGIASPDQDSSDNIERLFELKDLSVVFPEGELSVVTGPTASGKTALLMAVLGEMTLLKGRIIMSKEPSCVDEYGLMHSISYAAQTPWLRHQTIKDNILFGYPLDEERYNEVVECCALRADLDQFEDGDATEIGARGINLSGGQKARVALARAVYARTKYVLLDDPLSAVDSHTARHLYDRLLLGPLLAHRTIILVTHHVELVLPGTHYLVQMLDGRIDVQGTVQDLRSQGILEEIVAHADVDSQKADLVIAEQTAMEDTDQEGTINPDAIIKKPRVLVKDEHREVGGVKWSIYNSYLKASSYWTWAVIAVFTLIVQLLNLGEKLWIKIWGNSYRPNIADIRTVDLMDSQNKITPIDGYFLTNSFLNLIPITIFEWPRAADHPLFYVGIYAAIGLSSAFAHNIAGMAQYSGALRASRLLFGQLLTSVVRATFRFHDTTPQGRMLNRFGKDIETIDTGLAASLQSVNSSMTGFFTSIITIAVVFPYFLIPAIFIGYTYRELAIGYLNTGRDLRRMESNSRSPIYSDFGELLEGIVTVRAFSAEKRFLNNLHTKLDITTKMWYFFWMTNRWLLLNYDVLGAVAVLVTTLFSIYTLKDDAGLAGLCITSAMAFTNSVYWACRNWTALELDLNAVERIIEYLRLPQEPPAIIESNRVPAYWPSRSTSNPLLVAENLEIRYAPELPAVLHNISFSLTAGERVGLLGRTGSGKSTLAMSLLRFVDASSGRILIDGVDISTIGTHDLRSRLTFIPQDANLFSGTLRENLNPFGEYEDSECLDALHRVHLMEPEPAVSGDQLGTAAESDTDEATERGLTIDSQSTHTQVERDKKPIITLDTKVAAGGANFSQGQRQLIAMARALLRQSPLVILDEATSSIDFATDAKIQKTIREQFNDSLLLTIAHRLRTVIDYDRIIVLDKGEVAEFDTPWNLINQQDGIFRNMCLTSGSFAELEKAAKLKAQSPPY